jgi:hypothetical protein
MCCVRAVVATAIAIGKGKPVSTVYKAVCKHKIILVIEQAVCHPISASPWDKSGETMHANLMPCDSRARRCSRV